jgi:hypothetical protein
MINEIKTPGGLEPDYVVTVLDVQQRRQYQKNHDPRLNWQCELRGCLATS